MCPNAPAVFRRNPLRNPPTLIGSGSTSLSSYLLSIQTDTERQILRHPGLDLVPPASPAPSISRVRERCHLARAIGNIFEQYTTLRVACVCAPVRSRVCFASFVSGGNTAHSTQGTSRSPKLPGVPAPRTGHIGHGSWADRGATWGITELSLTYTSVHLGVTEARATSAMAARARLPLQRPAPQRPAKATAAGPHAPSRTWLRRSCS